MELLEELHGGVGLAETFRQRPGCPVRGGLRVVVGTRGVEGAAGVAVRSHQAVDDLVLGQLQVLGDLLDRRRPAQDIGQGLLRLASSVRSSCSRRGTCTAQVVSRKYRFISPVM